MSSSSDVPGLDPDKILLIEAARAVVAGFRMKVEGGVLPSHQHAPLLLLEAALEPFAGITDAKASVGDTGERSPGPDIGLSAPATAQDQSAAA